MTTTTQIQTNNIKSLQKYSILGRCIILCSIERVLAYNLFYTIFVVKQVFTKKWKYVHFYIIAKKKV